ncbi:MAG TPA: hypothetical protein VF020_16885 [Chthoniobacterales bacterium]
MNSIIKFGLATIAAGTILGTTVTVKADEYASERSNPFTKHGLPVPGAYFKSQENQSATIAVSKSGKGVGQQTNSTATKKPKPVRSTNKAGNNG